jgi:hypothetical protein
MTNETYSATMVAAETLATDDWNVWVNPGSDDVLATKDGMTLKADISQHGRNTEDLLESFITEDMTRQRFEDIAWACLRSGYTDDEIEEAIELIWDA